MKMGKNKWAQEAVRRPGALKSWLKRGGARKIAAATRQSVWTRQGRINVSALKAFRKTEAYMKLPTKTKQRINLAVTLAEFRRRKRR